MPQKSGKKENASRAETTFSLKDQLFNTTTVAKLAKNVKRAHPKFTDKVFSKSVLAQFPELELKACIHCMATSLREHLPNDLNMSFDILEQALPDPLDPSKSDDDFGEFIWAVPNQFVATYGCNDEHLERSLAFLKESTKRFSAEFAIRPFLNKYPKRAFEFVSSHTNDENYHVRRWCSEGIRPFLPWAERVNLPAKSVVTVLGELHADPTRYVTRSVANTLNDLSKVDGPLVISTLKRWHKQKRQEPAELDWLTRHALRSLIKADNPNALQLLGYPIKPKFSLSKIQVQDQLVVGDKLRWQASLTSSAKQNLKLGLRLHFLKANGSHSVKVFALKEVAAQKGETFTLDKRIAMKPMTTRTLYHGEHHIELVVNGVIRGKRSFELKGS